MSMPDPDAQQMAMCEYMSGYKSACNSYQNGTPITALRASWQAYYPQRPQTQFAMGFWDAINDMQWELDCELAGIDRNDSFRLEGLIVK